MSQSTCYILLPIGPRSGISKWPLKTSRMYPLDGPSGSDTEYLIPLGMITISLGRADSHPISVCTMRLPSWGTENTKKIKVTSKNTSICVHAHTRCIEYKFLCLAISYQWESLHLKTKNWSFSCLYLHSTRKLRVHSWMPLIHILQFCVARRQMWHQRVALSSQTGSILVGLVSLWERMITCHLLHLHFQRAHVARRVSTDTSIYFV